MRNSAKLSTLLVPAIVIIAAASSCFAQAQLTEKPAASPSTVTLSGSELSLVLNRTQPVSVERVVSTEVKASSEATEVVNLSADRRDPFTARFTSVDTNRFMLKTQEFGKSRASWQANQGSHELSLCHRVVRNSPTTNRVQLTEVRLGVDRVSRVVGSNPNLTSGSQDTYSAAPTSTVPLIFRIYQQ